VEPFLDGKLIQEVAERHQAHPLMMCHPAADDFRIPMGRFLSRTEIAGFVETSRTETTHLPHDREISNSGVGFNE
jgi:hypothetical protein